MKINKKSFVEEIKKYILNIIKFFLEKKVEIEILEIVINIDRFKSIK